MSQPNVNRYLLVILFGFSAAGRAQLEQPAAAAVAGLEQPTAAAETALLAAPFADEPRWQFGFALGYGERDNPLALSDDLKVLVDLDIAWFGDRWFFDNGDGGFMLADGDRFTVNLIGRFNSDRVFFSKIDSDIIVINRVDPTAESQPVVPDRDYAVELGLELLSDGDWGHLQLAVHRDASNVHEGYELYVNFGRQFRKQRWSFEPSLGASWKSRRLNDYYWGVHDDESSHLFPTYRADAGLNQHARFSASYRLDKKWTFFAIAEFERLNAAAARSPLVEQRDLRGVFAGFHYRL